MLSRRRLLAGAAVTAVAAACTPTARSGRQGSDARVPASASAATPPTASTAAASGGPATFVASGPTTAKAVALTFHTNGDPALCQTLFEDARRLQVPVTFFVVGNFLAADESVGPRLLADGHELANHTQTHPALGTLSAADVLTEITGCRDELQHAVGQAGRWFRPSGMDLPTPLVLDAAAAAGYDTVVGYDIDPLDYQDPGAVAVRDRVAQRLHPGAIVSLHTSHQGTLDAFADMVGDARAAGYTLVTVSNLLGR